MSYAGRLTGAIRVILGALLGAAFLVASAMPASAHTALAASSPKDGGRLNTAPNQVLLEFTEPILTVGARLAVQGPDGRRYESGTPQVTGKKLVSPLKALGPAGRYRVQIRVVAADGHPLNSGISFTLTKPGPAVAGSNAAEARPAPVYAVQTSTNANTAPSWAPWAAVAAAVVLASGAMWFGRRVTHGLD